VLGMAQRVPHPGRHFHHDPSGGRQTASVASCSPSPRARQSRCEVIPGRCRFSSVEAAAGHVRPVIITVSGDQYHRPPQTADHTVPSCAGQVDSPQGIIYQWYMSLQGIAQLDGWRKERRRGALGRVLAAVGLGAGAKGVLPAAPAAAHSIVPCGGDSPVVNAASIPGDANQIYKLSPGLSEAAADDATNAVNAWAWFTDVNYGRTTNNFPAWDVYLTRGDDPARPGLAGLAEFRWRSNCVLEGTYLWYNQTHVEGAGEFADTDKRCVYVHEVGHSLGLGHSNIASHNDTGGAAHPRNETVMRGQEHGVRCHVDSPPIWPGSADVSDVNGKY
jgi:hypothetical protein